MVHLASLAIAFAFPVRVIAAVPPAQDILDRMLRTIAEISNAVSADARVQAAGRKVVERATRLCLSGDREGGERPADLEDR